MWQSTPEIDKAKMYSTYIFGVVDELRPLLNEEPVHRMSGLRISYKDRKERSGEIEAYLVSYEETTDHMNPVRVKVTTHDGGRKTPDLGETATFNVLGSSCCLNLVDASPAFLKLLKKQLA